MKYLFVFLFCSLSVWASSEIASFRDLVEGQKGCFRLYNCSVDLKIEKNSEDCDQDSCGKRINVYVEDNLRNLKALASFDVYNSDLKASKDDKPLARLLLFKRDYMLGNEKYYENLELSLDKFGKIEKLFISDGNSGKSPVFRRVLCQRYF